VTSPSLIVGSFPSRSPESLGIQFHRLPSADGGDHEQTREGWRGRERPPRKRWCAGTPLPQSRFSSKLLPWLPGGRGPQGQPQRGRQGPRRPVRPRPPHPRLCGRARYPVPPAASAGASRREERKPGPREGPRGRFSTARRTAPAQPEKPRARKPGTGREREPGAGEPQPGLGSRLGRAARAPVTFPGGRAGERSAAACARAGGVHVAPGSCGGG
jgi:hypothetical protein